jgi:hypothetical protein
MRIISQFKDYYDFVAYLHGGGDPLITYNRHRLVPLRQSYGSLMTGTLSIEQEGVRQAEVDYSYVRHPSTAYYKWLVVCGRYFLMVQLIGESDWNIFSEKLHPHQWKNKIGRTTWDNPVKTTPEKYLNCPGGPELIELHKKVGAPVFTYSTRFNGRKMIAEIDGEIPNLGEIGMAPLVAPEIMYQDISFFVGNVLKVSPEQMHPSPMSNKDKISSHGFDLVQSFRHRK